MANNIIVDVSEINQAIQKVNDLNNRFSKDHSTIENIIKEVGDLRNFHATYALKANSWKTSTKNGKAVRSLTVAFSKIHFYATPVVHVSIEGIHNGLQVSLSNVTHSGCEIHVMKTQKSNAFSSAELGHKIHLSAHGY